MKPFLDENFLLETKTAQKLYHEYAAQVPVLDYHCHLVPQEIAEDIHFKNMTELWLGADHYKWRIMRSNGVAEKYITGDASDEEKFKAFAEALPKCIGNPMYHWCHLELQRYFGISETLSGKNWKSIYDKCNEILARPEMSAKGLIRMSGVTLVCTTDDPVDDLHYHESIAADKDFDVQVLPAWRPDMIMSPEKEGYNNYIKKLSDVSGVEIVDFKSLKKALSVRLDYFAKRGCCVSDHGPEYSDYCPVSEGEMEELMQKSLTGGSFTVIQKKQFATGIMLFLGAEYKKRDWVMQLHYGAKRENNELVFRSAGANAGVDCINPAGFVASVADYLNALNREGNLPKTILYSLNPTDNALIGTMIGCFQGEGVRGKVQQGAAWWFNDHKYGMEEHMKSLASLSLLGNFIGMLTDSRSFISYPRHEYFRRIMCNFIGNLVENGEYPEDYEQLGEIVQDISYNNAVRYFGFQL